MLTINPSTVDLWYAYLPDYVADLSLLSPDELARAERFKFAVHRQRFSTTRSLLRQMLSRYLSCEPQLIQFSYEVRGKPYLENQTLQFNVSHSEDVALIAITEKNLIGVDVEKIKHDYPSGVAEKYFHPEEIVCLSKTHTSEKPSVFYKIWSRKEALLKAIGEGLWAPLHECSVLSDRVVVAEKEWSIQTVRVHSEYQAAVVVQQLCPNIILKNYQVVMDL